MAAPSTGSPLERWWVAIPRQAPCTSSASRRVSWAVSSCLLPLRVYACACACACARARARARACA
eukprot:2128807-Alexandrium_andersonii.AAC.1